METGDLYISSVVQLNLETEETLLSAVDIQNLFHLAQFRSVLPTGVSTEVVHQDQFLSRLANHTTLRRKVDQSQLGRENLSTAKVDQLLYLSTMERSWMVEQSKSKLGLHLVTQPKEDQWFSLPVPEGMPTTPATVATVAMFQYLEVSLMVVQL